jgi:hypothetical protein
MPFKIVPPLYSVWQGMKRRCYNPNFKQFKDYGGRGIRVCDRWLTDYATFESDMGTRPEGTSIDRYPDPDGDYSPENCRWATKQMQQRNQRRSRRLVIDGIDYLAVDLSHKYGIKTDTIIARAKKGLPFDMVISHSRAPYTITKENRARIKEGQQKSQNARKHCARGHEYNEKNTHISPQGTRVCRVCDNYRGRQSRRAVQELDA